MYDKADMVIEINSYEYKYTKTYENAEKDVDMNKELSFL